ncbi:MAG: hypothetical protein AAF581_07795 [Planctomycetota bacterium]
MLARIIAFVIATFVGSSASAMDDRYKLHMATYDLTGVPLQLLNLLDIVPGTAGAPQDVTGCSFSVCTDPGVTVLEAGVGASIAFANGGIPPSYLEVRVYPTGGYSVVFAIDLQYVHTLPPDTNYELGWSRLAGVDLTSPPYYCQTLGTPPVVANIFGPLSSFSAVPEMVPGIVEIATPTLGFTRGDCYTDGTVNIVDIVAALLAAFPPPGTAPSYGCADACDANDDGDLTIADAVALLNFIFAVPPLPIPPPHGCGIDTSIDGLGCSYALPCL